MNRKEYKLPDGRMAILDYDDYGVAKVSREFMESVIESLNRPAGRWEYIDPRHVNFGHKCSNCGAHAKDVKKGFRVTDNPYCHKAEPITEYDWGELLSDYCPNCGADMKGADDEAD